MQLPETYGELEEFQYNPYKKNFRRGGHTWYLLECKNCNSEYFGYKGSLFCSRKCSVMGKFNPMYGKKLSEDAKRKIRDLWKDESSVYNNVEYRKSLSNKGASNGNWKGGVTKKKLALYDTYAPQLNWCEEVRRNPEDSNLLEVKCFKCGKWYKPNYTDVCNRIQSINGNEKYKGEFRFYCSENCKHSCYIYGKKPETLMREDAVRAGHLQWLELNREVQPELRQMVLARDNYECQKCGNKEHLHCHHIIPIFIEPILSADINNCITLCEECHKQVHKLPGCGYNEIQMEICLNV